MDFFVRYDHSVIPAPIQLPASKSILARALVINALSDRRLRRIPPVLRCEDTGILHAALRDIGSSPLINLDSSGTAMRFLTAYCATKEDTDTILTGSSRLLERPVGPLVDALRSLGADIVCLDKDGFPPLKIHGKRLSGGEVEITGEVSSQFISALLLIGPTLPGGLVIKIKGEEIPSKPYVDMTRAIMSRAGVTTTEIDPFTIVVPEQPYTPLGVTSAVPDWSAATFLYEFVALAGKPLILKDIGSPESSVQGDSRVAEIFKSMGVRTLPAKGDDILLQPGGSRAGSLDLNMSGEPDMVPAVAVTATMLNIPFSLSGVGNLRIKESDRIAALSTEMERLGYQLTFRDGTLSWNGQHGKAEPLPCIDTYNDHRIAMAMTMAACRHPGLLIRDVMVVKKSFPKFWHIASRVGIKYTITSQSVKY